ncbi:hypothetical protein EDD25_3177 [Cryobacterium psychrophilum]|nr:hypothetical protein EDD25_3177 [Cryobacterium psychrophilum]
MTFTCPYCSSQARLSPNPAYEQRTSLPMYLLVCTGCEHTSVSRVPLLVIPR